MIVYKCDICGDVPTAMYELIAKPMFGVFIGREGLELTTPIQMHICQSCFEKISGVRWEVREEKENIDG